MTPTKQRAFKILSWNIRSLTVRGTILQKYVADNNIDIVCLQEPFPTVTRNKKPPNFSGYNHYVSDLSNGLVMYVHNSIPHKLIDTSRDTDNQFQVVQINVNNSSFYVCNTYIRKDKMNCNKLPQPGNKGFFYVGDLNARHPNFGDNVSVPSTNGNKLLKFVHSQSLTVYPIPEPTHVMGGHLDYSIGVNVAHNNVKPPHIVKELMSDHFAILTEYTITVVDTVPHQRKKLIIPTKHHGPFLHHLTSWYENYTPLDVSTFYNDLVNFTQEFYDVHIKKNNRKKPTPPKRPEWTQDGRLETQRLNVIGLADIYRRDRTAEALKEFLDANREYKDLANQLRSQNWGEFLKDINAQTSSGEMWQKINRITRGKSSTPIHHCPADIAAELLQTWSSQSKVSSLPVEIQTHLQNTDINRRFNIEIACSEIGATDRLPITSEELRIALVKGKATSPGDDGITYSVLRLIAQVPGNPLLRLYNMSLSSGVLPQAWTESTIIPIPKPTSNEFRPISLTSCFCKVLERIILTRLMFHISDKLSPNLYGFTQGKSTQHCFAEYFSHTTNHSCTAFIDLKSAFDVAHRDIILEQLAGFGVNGRLLEWIRNYLSQRRSKVLFRGALSATEPFELGTPQGGVLSPTLFNVLMHKLLQGLNLLPDETVISYADDICIKTNSPRRLQEVLDQFASSSRQCGLIISINKTKVHIQNQVEKKNCNPLHIGNNEIAQCNHYRYLGIDIAFTQRPKDYLQNFIDQLDKRLNPLKTLVSNKIGVNISIAREVYILFVRSLIDYHALHLANLTVAQIDKLDRVQNKAMRIILGCAPCTRIVNMRTELNLTSIHDRIKSLTATMAVKCLRQPNTAPKFSHDLHTVLASPHELSKQLIAQKHISCENWFKQIYTTLKDFQYYSSFQPYLPIEKLEPWKRTKANTSSVNILKRDQLCPLQLQGETLATIAEVMSSMPRDTRVAYTDGSLQNDGRAGCGFEIFHDQQSVYSRSSRLNNWVSITQCELVGIQAALEYLVRNYCHGLIISDSKAALYSINSLKPECSITVSIIQSFLSKAEERHLVIHFLWIPSHIGLSRHDRVDRLAKEACHHPEPYFRLGLTSKAVQSALRKDSIDELNARRDAERPGSYSIKYYDRYYKIKHKYGKHKTLTRHCDVVAARIRMGYRHIWQVDKREVNNDFSNCKVCDAPKQHNLVHYIAECPLLSDFRPRGYRFYELTNYFTQTDILEDILLLYPGFASP